MTPPAGDVEEPRATQSTVKATENTSCIWVEVGYEQGSSVGTGLPCAAETLPPHQNGVALFGLSGETQFLIGQRLNRLAGVRRHHLRILTQAGFLVRAQASCRTAALDQQA